MAKAKAKAGLNRINLAVNDRVKDRLLDLKDRTEAESLTEVIRRALAVYDHLQMLQDQDGAEVILKFPDGEEKSLRLL